MFGHFFLHINKPALDTSALDEGSHYVFRIAVISTASEGHALEMRNA